MMKAWITASAIALALGSLLGVPSSMPALSATSSVEGIVVPDSLHDKQPFSFSVTQAAQQQVDISSVSGVVVRQTTTDKFGRIFLAAGLPAGAYLISTAGKPAGKIEIKPGAASAPAQGPPQLTNPPQTYRIDQPNSLSGHGFDPNCAKDQVSLSAAGGSQSPVILAATEDQLKLAPVQQLAAGPARLTVTNMATNQTFGPKTLLAYSLDGRLVKTKLTSGADQTQLVVDAKPHELPLVVQATVASGPVDFGNGRKQADMVAQNGQAVFLIHAEPGAGPFQVNFALAAGQQITEHDQCRCSLKSGRCIPTEDYYCEEMKTPEGKWSCISTKIP